MKRHLSANKPLTIMGLAMTLMLTLVATFGYTALHQAKQIEQTFHDFFQHPFTVSNAAGQLRYAVTKSQLILTNQLQSLTPSQHYGFHQNVETLNTDINRQLQIIQSQFLGDMDKIHQLEKLLEKWQKYEMEIHLLITDQESEKAKHLFQSKMVLLNEQINVLTDYILGFALNKAKQYESKAMQSSEQSTRLLTQAIMLTLTVIITILGYLIWYFYQYSERVETRALTDKLTGLFNRAFLEAELPRQFNLADEETSSVYTMQVIDVDNFKQVNDTYGHNIGDQVLVTLANELKHHFRKDDIIVRWGGDEFVLILPNTSEIEALAIAESFRARLEDMPIQTDKGIIYFTVTIGISEFLLSEPIKQAFERSDAALYQAKQRGRNCVASYKSLTPQSDH
ncbi:hypothetical protein CYQ88_10305 [Hydrogenovibrio sp. SC-1]|uniref:GGDEF domain-containing protein n=1 Tax=Hydrogenovibrio sp. SC-1 TaxID=2065820 RepID=UPI000C7C2767|nr:GGDEF domain-containing protein [Hydrogenovibrio sp. SC-1]PLA73584.1 hypothetical protein CYQ88_10305 [Hydrogenovibrio sp. SC-1]